jgi:tRNA(Ile)-lysidine synthase
MLAAEPAPLDDSELPALFEPFAERGAIAVAVSGGADSLALMVLLRRWLATRVTGPLVWVLTVDHRLRPNSAAEAASVAATAKRLGMRHRILKWDGPKPETGIEEAAREARYRLLCRTADKLGVSDVLTAHHRDDQVETVLMRLGHGSGLTGLAGMRAVRPLNSKVKLHRPLLGVAKARLVATTLANGLAPIEDETNRDERFARPRLRRVMPVLNLAGLDSDQIARAATRLARADEAVDHYVDGLLKQAVAIDRFAVAKLDRAGFAAAPEEVRLRALSRLIGAAGGSDWPPPRSERLEALERSIVAGERFKRTLGGAVVAASDEDVQILREGGRTELPRIDVTAGDEGVWDGRFAYRISKAPAGLVIGPLGPAGIKVVGLRQAGLSPAAAAVLPALWLNKEVVAVPPLALKMVADGSISADMRCILDRRIAR